MNVIQSDKISLLRTTPAHIEFVYEAERHPDNRPFVSQWSQEEHRLAADDPNILHLIIESEQDGRAVGYLLLVGLQSPHHSMEIRRLVITDKGKGYGREALRLAKSLAFDRYGAHRLWLDVRGGNDRAQQLYQSEGFIIEGVLRESMLVEGSYHSLTIMSILEDEYR